VSDLVSSRSAVETEVLRIRALLGHGGFSEALSAADALLAQVPENRDLLLLRACAQRRQGDAAGALATLARLEELYPRFSHLYEERGLCHVKLRQAPQAIEALLHGLHLNPAMSASWRMLETLYRTTGQAAPAAHAAAQLAALQQLPTEIVTATGLFYDGQLGAADELTHAFVRAHGQHLEAVRLLARISIERGAFEDAQPLLEAVLERRPDYHAARCDYARVLLRRQLYARARAESERLLALDPAHRDYRLLHALSCTGLGQHELALDIYRGLLPGARQPEQLHLAIGHLLKARGRTSEAIAAYHAAAADRPGYGDAYWSLANLKTYRFGEPELETMRAAEVTATLPDRYQLCFALGAAFEERERYAESFAYYARGNALKHSECRYRPESTELNTRLQIEVCTPELLRRHGASGVSVADPIFIVGLPRSGSTLIEQILASHSAVEGTQELADIPRLVAELQGRDGDDPQHPPYPAVLAQMSAADFCRLGEKYLADTRAYRSGKVRFIDKMPNNFRHIGLIHLMLPEARIIDARREPMACCFGNFKQLFAHGQEFTYSLEDLARYYRSYLELMWHWDAVLPGRVLRVQHEDLVDDLEGNVRRLLDYCRLAFEPACLEFHRTERSVRTASAEQVRQPLYAEGREQWRHYEPWLGALRAALGDALTRYRD
jgi:tetratricopeptide (TPR) repeat protein